MPSYISGQLPGIGGQLRRYPQDFRVQEIPAYPLCGQGEHLFIEITKEGITTQAAISELAQRLGIPASSIGYAGLKDRQAMTTQRLSLPACAWPGATSDLEPKAWPLLPDLSFQVEILGLHNNKLKTGHLQGNRFAIRVRQANPRWPQLVPPILQALRRHGMANFYGPQRFGRQGDNALKGLEGLRRGYLPGPKWRKSRLISALQSQLFNRWLEERIADGLFEKAIIGDVFGKLPQGGIFYSLEPQAEQPRLEAFQISPMGPIFGYKMFKAQGEALEREERILKEADIKLEEFRALKAEGSRRRARLPVEDLEICDLEGDPLFTFTLPAGSYASVLVGEFMKSDLAPSEEDEVDSE